MHISFSIVVCFLICLDVSLLNAIHTLKKMKYINTAVLGILILAACNQDKRDEGGLSYDTQHDYDEQYRPQFHFSPPQSWMNDPNGMVYHKGIYHLFYQYYPDSTVWGPMHWGHAISDDLVHWKHLPIALYPDSLGYIFSGSAVVDAQNTTGFGSADNPPLVAIFTHHHAGKAAEGSTDYQYQSLAYSLDDGLSWEKYPGNPVLKNPGTEEDFRDPKVFWYEKGGYWVMILAVKDHVEFYQSSDLKDWTYLSDFGLGVGAHGGVWECPDLFELTSKEGESRWVMLLSINPGGLHGGSGTQYFVGNFDGTTFTTEFDSTAVHWLDYGADNYAGVTWSDVPSADGRRLFIGWMSNWEYGQEVPTEAWRSAMTIPRKLGLQKDDKQKWIVTSTPVRELNQLTESSTKLTKQLVKGMAGFSEYIDKGIFRVRLNLIRAEDTHDFVFSFSNNKAQKVNFGYNPARGVFFFDRLSAGVDDFSSKFGILHEVPFNQKSDTLKLDVFVDHSSIELFVNDGELVMTETLFPTSPYYNFTLDTKTQALLINGEIMELRSIWK